MGPGGPVLRDLVRESIEVQVSVRAGIDALPARLVSAESVLGTLVAHQDRVSTETSRVVQLLAEQAEAKAKRWAAIRSVSVAMWGVARWPLMIILGGIAIYAVDSWLGLDASDVISTMTAGS